MHPFPARRRSGVQCYARTIALAERASAANAAVALFPELGLSAYTCDDLFQQDALLEGVLDALNRLIDASRSLTPVLLVGAPAAHRWRVVQLCDCHLSRAYPGGRS
jgi:predicted amidohydrolase